MPVEGSGGVDVAGHEPRRLGVIEVGDDENGARVLGEAVGHLFQAQADVLDADLLGDDEERHRRETPMHAAHQPRQHRAVAHAGVEHPERRRPRMDVGELHAGALGHHRLFVTGVDEHQVLLAIVVEAEGPLAAGARLGGGLDGGDRAGHRGGARRPSLKTVGGSAGRRIIVHAGAQAGDGLYGDALAIAQAAHELAVVHGAAPEGGLGEPATLAIGLDFADEPVHFVHAR